MSKLCVQDIPVSVDSKSDKNARVLFDNGSQTTLVRDHFAEQAGWSYTKAQYTLAGIGNKSRLIQGKLWNVTLKDREGKMHVIQGYGVPSILQENWYFPAIKDVAGKFPNVPKEVFLAQESRPLDILIGTDSLNLMPKCNYGSDCKNCEDGLCCYQSKFSLGWVSVGQCRPNPSQNISCPVSFSICLQKIVPHNKESFFLGKQAKVFPLQNIPSKENIADINTRSGTQVSKSEPNFSWPLGPPWLSKSKGDWPVTRSFIKKELPGTEYKSPTRTLVSTNKVSSYRCPFVINALKSCNDDTPAKVTKNLLNINSKLASFNSSISLLEGHKMQNSKASHRTRQIAFIHRPRKLVKNILDNYGLYRLKREQTS